MTTHDPGELMRRLRGANPVRLSPEAAHHPRADAIYAAITTPSGEGRPRARAPRRLRRRALLLALAGAVVASGAAYGAVRWSEGDLPAAGAGPNAFVLPATEMLPSGRPSVHPPAYAGLPVRPSIAFPRGVGYTSAVRLYYDARQRGEILPDGATLADPLPEGKVVKVDAGRVFLDPAAPVGYDLATGLVSGFVTGAPAESRPAPALPRCEVLLGPSDSGPTCPSPPARVARVQEIDGTWRAVTPVTIGAVPPAGTTALSVLAEAPTAVPQDWRDPVTHPTFAQARADLDQARLAVRQGGVRYLVVPAADQRVCLVAAGPVETAATCNPLGVLATAGRIPLVSTAPDGSTTYAALVGDGWVRARLSDGRRVPIHRNVVVVSGVLDGTSITLVGPGKERVIRAG